VDYVKNLASTGNCNSGYKTQISQMSQVTPIRYSLSVSSPQYNGYAVLSRQWIENSTVLKYQFQHCLNFTTFDVFSNVNSI